MKKIKLLNLSLLSITLQIVLLEPERVFSQIIPDNSLGQENSQVKTGETSNELRIDQGAVRGSNLFHSFSEFNVTEGQSVYFLSSPTIQNIFSRVTGSNSSNLLGKLGVYGGNANLFLLNPNGILFGPNATLDLKGSFLASTANQITFKDNYIFSASNSTKTVLTSSIPIGLGFLNPTGNIKVQGIGHNFIQFPITRIPNQSPTNTEGLSVEPQRTISLVANQIELQGGILSAPSGNIALSSISNGNIGIEWSTPYSFLLNPQESTFSEVNFIQRSLLNASGTTNGNIQVFGKNITLNDSSFIFIENQGSQNLGKIQISATGTLEIIGITNITDLTPSYPPFTRLSRGIVSQALESGNGADVIVQAKDLILRSSGQIYTSEFGTGNAGNISVAVKEAVNIFGVAPSDPNFLVSSLIASASAGNARTGTITLNSKILTIQEGGFVSTVVLEDGVGGDVFINSSNILVEGINKSSFFPSLIAANNQARGIAGNLYINSKYVLVENGGRIDASNVALGRAGNLTITADTVEVKGKSQLSNDPSLITASSSIPNELLQENLSLPNLAGGASGNLTISANHIYVLDGALVTVSHEGTGNGGTLSINSKSLTLNNGNIVATSQAGLGGNISLTTDHDITLIENSTISATAGGTGNGGNVTINSRFLILNDNSSITAQAFQGKGGNINLTVQGLLESPQSLISASSEFGVDGLVSVERTYKFEDALFIPNYDYLQIEEILDRFCNSEESKGSFQIIGSGSLPPSPNSGINSSESLINIPKPSQSKNPEPPAQTVIVRPEAKWKGGRIVEGNTRLRLPDGRIILINVPESLKNSDDLRCPASKSTPDN